MPFDYGFWGLLESGHLPGVKISGFKLNTASSDPAKAPNKDSGGRSYYAHRDQCHFHAAQSGPQATLASDKLGKEMDPDGAIWQLYQEESREHDKELIENRDKSLDVLLIYAGLFSSVLAGFLVDSKTLLQQDTETASMKLLLYIAQSQRAESNGSLSTPIELPSLSFTASNSARWINALWFLALFISLSTALITMLAKEWLQAYISSQPRSPHAHALLHQARLRGLYKWHALHIIDFLPSALHFSLLLFSIGIVIYLRELDYLVAALVATFIGFVFLFYVATTVFASCSMFCPFITQASRYIRQYLFKFPECATWADEQSKEAQGSEATTYHELRALFWLATFARDPAVGQCVYQALAGLRIPRVQKNTPPGAKEGKLSQLQNVDQGGEIDIYRSRSDLQHGQQEEDVSQRSPSRVESIQPSMVAKHTMVSQKHFDLLHKFFQATCAHLPTLLDTEERQISTRRCTSISKHANALPHLTALLNSCYVRPLPKRIPSWSFTNSGKLMGDDELGLPIFNDNQARESPTQIIKKALDSLDAVWGEHKSYITADSHSLLALAELRLTQALTTALVTENVNPEISADNTDRVTLFEPRARASRVLFRVAILLKSYSVQRIHIHADILIDLMTSLREAFEFKDLCPPNTHPMSTNYWQDLNEAVSDHAAPNVWAVVAGSYSFHFLDPTTIGDSDGLIVGLLHIIGKHDIRESYDLAITARKTLHVVAPVLLSQWFRTIVKRQLIQDSSELAYKFTELLRGWPLLTKELETDHSHENHWTTKHLLILAQVGALFASVEDSDAAHLSHTATQTLCDITKGFPGRVDARMTLYEYRNLLQEFLKLALENYEYMHSSTIEYLLRLLLPEPTRHPVLTEEDDSEVPICLDSACYTLILKLWVRGTGSHEQFQRLMAALSNHHLYPAEDGYGALGLLLSSRQLCELVKLGELDKYSRIVVEYIIQWTAAVFQSPQNTQVASWPTDYYFEDFLGAAAFVLENAPSEELKHKFLTSFMNASNIYLNQPARAQAQINSVRRIIQLVERYDDKLPHSLQHEELVLKCLRRPVNSSGGLGTFNDSDHVLEVGIGDISESPAAASPVLPPLPSSSTSENDRTEDDLV